MIFLRACFCGSFVENCGDLRRLTLSSVQWNTSIAEICGDDESAQKLRRQMTKSWLVEHQRDYREMSHRIWIIRNSRADKIAWHISKSWLARFPNLALAVHRVETQHQHAYIILHIYIYICIEREIHNIHNIHIYIYIYICVHTYMYICTEKERYR